MTIANKLHYKQSRQAGFVVKTPSSGKVRVTSANLAGLFLRGGQEDAKKRPSLSLPPFFTLSREGSGNEEEKSKKNSERERERDGPARSILKGDRNNRSFWALHKLN